MTFQCFYKSWYEQLQQLVHQFRQVPTPPTAEEHHQQLHQLVQKTISHYAEYYRCKMVASKQDALAFFSAPWTTALERSLHWIAGWRPTTAFHIIYTESSILFESQVVDIMSGFHIGDLGDLSPEQFRRVSELQMQTVREEDAITDQLCNWQDDASNFIETVYINDVDTKMVRLGEILERADQLRLNTIKSLVGLMTPKQAAEFLVVTAELQFGIRGWGAQQDRQRRNS